jgi:hypothetical protein
MASTWNEIFNIDSVLSRTTQSFLIYILFLGVNVINLEFALATMSGISVVIAVFYLRRDGLFSLDTQRAVISLVFLVVGMFLIYVKQPTGEEVFTIVVKQGMAEELIFRLGMLGMLRRYLHGETIMQKGILAMLVLNSGLFSLLHHHIFLSLFALSLMYGYLFLKVGIVPSMVVHALWNFYQSLEALVIIVVAIVMYEAVITFRMRKRPFFRWYKRRFDASEKGRSSV